MKSDLTRLREILADWSSRGPIDPDQHFEATEILRRIQQYAESHPLPNYASGKLAILKDELHDLHYRTGKRAKRVASLATLLSDATGHAIVVECSINTPDE